MFIYTRILLSHKKGCDLAICKGEPEEPVMEGTDACGYKFLNVSLKPGDEEELSL